jgi:hypothetical protein
MTLGMALALLGAAARLALSALALAFCRLGAGFPTPGTLFL